MRGNRIKIFTSEVLAFATVVNCFLGPNEAELMLIK